MSFLIAAPSSGSGKTTITLGLLRALTQRGVWWAAKSGPDYIDPRFHAAACGNECFNLDAWAMQETRIASLAAGNTPLIIEGAMGLFDGAPPHGKGACADLARQLDLPVILVIDAARMAQSVAPIAQAVYWDGSLKPRVLHPNIRNPSSSHVNGWVEIFVQRSAILRIEAAAAFCASPLKFAAKVCCLFSNCRGYMLQQHFPKR